MNKLNLNKISPKAKNRYSKLKAELTKIESSYLKHKNYLKRAINEGNEYNKKCSIRALELWYKDHLKVCNQINALLTKHGIDITY